MQLNLAGLAVPAVPVGHYRQRETSDNTPRLVAQGAANGFPVIPALPVTASHTAIPVSLLELVNEAARLGHWPPAEQVEHLAIIRRQLASGEFDAATLAAGWQAHLDNWHNREEAIAKRTAIMHYDGGLPLTEAEPLATQVNHCLHCRHWQGEQTITDAHTNAMAQIGISRQPTASNPMGICRLQFKPWRVSNLPGNSLYRQWHFIGQCSFTEGNLGR